MYAKEVLQVSNSVAKWTWKNQHLLEKYINRGVMNLPDSMTLEEKQKASAIYMHEIRKKTTAETILESATVLKSQGTPITQKSVSIHSGISLLNIKRYWKQVADKFNLYSYSMT